MQEGFCKNMKLNMKTLATILDEQKKNKVSVIEGQILKGYATHYTLKTSSNSNNNDLLKSKNLQLSIMPETIPLSIINE